MKPRLPFTFEAALLRIIEKVGLKESAVLLGKSESLLRKASDPDVAYQLPLPDAVLLDRAFCTLGHGSPPLLQAYSDMIEAEETATPNHSNTHPLSGLANIMEEVGELAEGTNNAVADNVLTNNELAEISKVIDDAIDALNALRRSFSDMGL